MNFTIFSKFFSFFAFVSPSHALFLCGWPLRYDRVVHNLISRFRLCRSWLPEIELRRLDGIDWSLNMKSIQITANQSLMIANNIWLGFVFISERFFMFWFFLLISYKCYFVKWKSLTIKERDITFKFLIKNCPFDPFTVLGCRLWCLFEKVKHLSFVFYSQNKIIELRE